MSQHISMPEAEGIRLRGLAAGCILAPLLLFLPFLVIKPVMFFGNSDALFYSNILALVSDSLQSGDIFPRWLAEANAGFGSSVMLFYAPLAYILTVIIELPLRWMHPDLETQFVIGIFITQVLSGLSAWAWLKPHFTARIAFAGSLAFVLLPYKFIYIYEHLNLAQLWALVFLPLWMRMAEKMAQGEGMRAASAYALMLAAVYYTHPLTVIAFGGVPLFYVVWYAVPQQRMRIYRHLLMAHMLAAGLCQMQALPQLGYRGWIHEEGFFEGKLDWHLNLYHMDIFLCAYYGLIAALVVCGIKYGKDLAASPHASRSFFWALVIAVIAFMNLPISSFLWEHLPLLKFLQFPAARLHCAALMGAVYLICVWLTHYREMLPLAPLAYSRRTLAALIILFGIPTLGRIVYTYSAANDLNEDYIGALHNARIIIPPEYRTRWNCISPSDALSLYHANRIPGVIEAQDKEARVTLQQWRPPEIITFTADVGSPRADIKVRQCYFPLWQATDNGSPALLAPAPPYGVLRLALAKGHHAVTITFAKTSWQRLAGYSSFLMLLLCLYLLRVRGEARQ